MPLDPNCSYCKPILEHLADGKPQEEKFNYFNGLAVYDIDQARQIVADGREVYQCPTEQLAGYVSYTGDPSAMNILATYVCPDHIDHVVDSKDDPVILAYSLPARGGDDPKRGRLPIDGHHRIARAVKYKQPVVHVVLLSEEETDGILEDNRPPLRKKKRTKNG